MVGFLLIVGFDKMFNVYFRTLRQQVIPPQDFGKTVGVITLLNNLSQPLAGLLVAVLAAPVGTQRVILLLALVTSLIGIAMVALHKNAPPCPLPVAQRLTDRREPDTEGGVCIISDLLLRHGCNVTGAERLSGRSGQPVPPFVAR